MLLGDPGGTHVIMAVAPETYTEGQTGPDVWVTVEAHVGAFSARLTTTVVRRDWDVFLEASSRLEETRRGEAILESVIEAELRVRIFATGSAGHVAIDGELHRRDVRGEPAFRFVGVEFEPDRLSALLQELRDAGPAV